MYIPKKMTDIIAKTFYDKEVSILDKNTSIDAEGGITSKGYIELNKFKGNVSFSNSKEIQEEYGLDYTIDISITTDVNVIIKIDDIIKYNDVVYKVTDVLPSDSHILIVATKWQ